MLDGPAPEGDGHGTLAVPATDADVASPGHWQQGHASPALDTTSHQSPGAPVGAAAATSTRSPGDAATVGNLPSPEDAGLPFAREYGCAASGSPTPSGGLGEFDAAASPGLSLPSRDVASSPGLWHAACPVAACCPGDSSPDGCGVLAGKRPGDDGHASGLGGIATLSPFQLRAMVSAEVSEI